MLPKPAVACRHGCDDFIPFQSDATVRASARIYRLAARSCPTRRSGGVSVKYGCGLGPSVCRAPTASAASSGRFILLRARTCLGPVPVRARARAADAKVAPIHQESRPLNSAARWNGRRRRPSVRELTGARAGPLKKNRGDLKPRHLKGTRFIRRQCGSRTSTSLGRKSVNESLGNSCSGADKFTRFHRGVRSTRERR